MVDKVLTEVDLGSEAISKLYEVLTWGRGYTKTASISYYLLRLQLENGRVKTFWPKDANPEEAGNYDSWGPYPFSHSPKPTGIKPEVKKLISDFLSSASNRYALFKTQAKEGDGGLERRKQPYVKNPPNEQVYYFVRSLDHTPNKIDDAVGFARYYPFVGCLTSLPKDDPLLKPFTEVTEATMEKLASRTDIIIIDAYDGVGFWIWYKNPIA